MIHTVQTYLMEPSSLVLTACLLLDKDLQNEEAFAGYVNDFEGTGRLLQELWDLYYAPFQRAETPEELVNSWYENTFENARIAF